MIVLSVLGLCSQVISLSDQLLSVEGKARAETEGLLERLHRLTSESTATRLENQRLKVSRTCSIYPSIFTSPSSVTQFASVSKGLRQ